jgi:hypothetical protein
MKEIKRLERLIERKQKEVREGKKRLAELKLIEAKERKKGLKVRTGRPRISREKLLQIELEAYDKPLTFVAFKHDVSIQTLYNYGISRKGLEKKIAESEFKESCEEKSKEK